MYIVNVLIQICSKNLVVISDYINSVVFRYECIVWAWTSTLNIIYNCCVICKHSCMYVFILNKWLLHPWLIVSIMDLWRNTWWWCMDRRQKTGLSLAINHPYVSLHNKQEINQTNGNIHKPMFMQHEDFGLLFRDLWHIFHPIKIIWI